MPKAKYKKRSDGRYLVQLKIGYNSNGKPKYKNIYASSVQELESKVAEFKSNLNKGFIIDDKGMTLARWADIWLKTYKNGVEYNTYEMYRRCIEKHIKTADIAAVKLSLLKTADIQRLINEKVAAGYTKTVTNLRQTLNQMFNMAVENDLIYKNIAKNIEVPVFGKKEKRTITPDEKNAIAAADFTLKERAFVYLCLYAGLRRGEALALSAGDIDFKCNSIKISKTLIFKNNIPEIKHTPKTKSSIRTVPLSEPLKSTLKEYMSTLTGVQLFSSPNNALMTETAYRRMWQRILKKINAEIKAEKPLAVDSDLTAHILRHTFATTLFYAGIDVKTAQKLLGHSSVAITLDIYTHLQDNSADLSDKLTKIFSA